MVKERDSKGRSAPLGGALVAAPQTRQSVYSADDGAFSLALADTVHTLVVSYVGYEPDTVLLTPGKDVVEVILNIPRNLEEVVIARRKKSTEISMIETIKTERIGAKELMKAACCNLSESFETTPSVDIAFTDAVSGYKQIQMLGLAGPYTLITRENIPDVRGLASVTGLTFTPGTWIEGMQLSKGTGSVVNGYESVAGQINVELIKPFADEADKWLFNLYQNTQGRSEGNVVYNHKFDDQLSTNLMLHGRSQWMKVDQNGDGFLDQPMGEQFVGLNRWYYFSPKGWEIQGGVKGTYVTNTGGQWDYTRNTEQVAGKPWGFELNTQRLEGWMKIGRVFRRPATSMGLQLAGSTHSQDARYGTRRYDATQNSIYANLIYQSYISNTNHVIKAGLSNIVDNYNEKVLGSGYTRTEIVPGAFAEYSYSHLAKFNLVAGLRGDYHNLYGAFVTPRLHLRYAPVENTAIRASIGRAQRTANIIAENMGYLASNRQLLIYGDGSNKAYGLDAEVAWNTGINLTQKFMLDYRDGAVSVDYYYTQFTNQVVVDVEDPHFVRFYNLAGQSFAHSFQVQADYEVVHNLDVRLAYRWYDVKTDYAGELKARPLVAAHRAFANIAYETRSKWKFDYTIHWTGQKRVPVQHHNHSPDVVNGYSPSFVQMNAQVTKGFGENFEVYLGGENLTNFMQHDAILGAASPFGAGFDASMAWGPVMGRNIYMGLRYRIK
ncbi:MAG: TonB-dependent receptor [Flavipsychrobacter sp.]|nr:TonB-dependent receptor [Flavipsychrobacter sp.]